MTPEHTQGQQAGGQHDDHSDGLRTALAALADLDARPTAAHVAAFEQMHAALTDALSSIDGA
jgi:hypothetical protein